MQINTTGLSDKEFSEIRKQVYLTGDSGFIGESKWEQMNTIQRTVIHHFDLAAESIKRDQ